MTRRWVLLCLWFLLITCVCGSFLFGSKRQKYRDFEEVRVGTYNMWNVMFNWDIRKYRIAELIQEMELDIVAFQEVHSHAKGVGNQLSELQHLLPEFRYSIFKPTHEVTKVKGSIDSGFTVEGLGLLSKYEIARVIQQNLTLTSGGSDRLPRMALHVSLALGDARYVQLCLVHFSYDRDQQCSNAVEVFKAVSEQSNFHSIVLGDFNAYTDFSAPTRIFTESELKKNPCFDSQMWPSLSQKLIFSDVWTSQHLDDGLTFSNMPDPGLVSRPDRILALRTMSMVGTEVVADGMSYRERYSSAIIRHRLYTMFWYMWTESGMSEGAYTCQHDCGPHASCRCGICVAGAQSCSAHHCSECSAARLPTVSLLVVCGAVVGFLLGTALLRALLRLRRDRHLRNMNSAALSVGCTCCCCQPQVYEGLLRKLRRFKLLHRLVSASPLHQLLFAVCLGAILTWTWFHQFSDMMHTVYSVIPEEFFPSDHRMVTAYFLIPK